MRVRILVITLLISALFVGCTPEPTGDGTVVTIKNIAKYKNGSHDIVYSKIPVMTLVGSHSEVGEQHGALLANEIKNYYEKVCVPYMDTMEANYRFGKKHFLAAAQKYLLPHIPGELADEMNEIAKASKMSFDDILLINTFVDIASVLAGRNNSLVPFAGVSYNFVDELTATSGPMMARNIDLRFGINTEFMHSYIFVVHPAKGKPYIYVSWPGMVGTMTGMNLSGLVMTSNPVTGPMGMQEGIPYTMLTRKILQDCDTIQDAHEAVIASKLIGGNSYLMCDANDNLCKIECTPNKLAVTHDHKLATVEGDQPEYTLSSFDYFVASALQDECIKMSAHDERAKVLSKRLSNLGESWTAEKMSNFSGNLQKSGETALSLVFVPVENGLYVWTAESGVSKFHKLDFYSTYEIIKLSK